MKTERPGPQRAAVLVISRVSDVLAIDADEQRAAKDFLRHANAVVALPDVLRGIVQAPVADDEIESAAAQIEGVDGGESAGCELAGEDVVFAAPQRAGH